MDPDVFHQTGCQTCEMAVGHGQLDSAGTDHQDDLARVDQPGEQLDPDGLQRRLTEAGFVVSIRGGALRVAPHAYNTPDEIDRLVDATVARFGGNAQLTRTDHQSGSDRIAEVVSVMGWPDDAIVVNLQGDEPLMPPAWWPAGP